MIQGFRLGLEFAGLSEDYQRILQERLGLLVAAAIEVNLSESGRGLRFPQLLIELREK